MNLRILQQFIVFIIVIPVVVSSCKRYGEDLSEEPGFTALFDQVKGHWMALSTDAPGKYYFQRPCKAKPLSFDIFQDTKKYFFQESDGKHVVRYSLRSIEKLGENSFRLTMTDEGLNIRTVTMTKSTKDLNIFIIDNLIHAVESHRINRYPEYKGECP
jgi:hypothetical protein